LNFGYRDFSRLPTSADGVCFTRPYAEGKPGIQPERLPPMVATLNPGFDPGLPLYRPMAMFMAQQAALVKDGPKPWSTAGTPRKSPPASADAQPAAPTIQQAVLIGDRNAPLGRRFEALGVSWADSDVTGPATPLAIVDIDNLTKETDLAALLPAAVRLTTSPPGFLQQLETAIDPEQSLPQP
jgi:beta-galactosidase